MLFRYCHIRQAVVVTLAALGVLHLGARGDAGIPDTVGQQQFHSNQDTSLVSGKLLYDCVRHHSPGAVAMCNDLAASRSLRLPPDIIKKGERFRITLIAEERFVNFFHRHYHEVVPQLMLSPELRLPLDYRLNMTTVWTFNGELPGPTIRARVGDILEVQLQNLLPMPIALFIPGIFNTREPLEGGFARSGQIKIFEIPLSEPGTFLYHSAVDAQRQVEMGLFGALVVVPNDQTPNDDPVVILSDPLVDSQTWQIRQAMGGAEEMGCPIRRAEEQYNGRRGNILLLNGESTSSGLQFVLRSGSIHRFRLINVCSARRLRLDLSPLRFKVETQWTDVELFDQEASTSVLILSPGSTAHIVVEVTDRMAGLVYEMFASEATPTIERRRAKLKEAPWEGDGTSSVQLASTVISETVTSIGPAMKIHVVDSLLVPFNDGILSLEKFVDAVELPELGLGHSFVDVAARVPSCEDASACTQPIWGFKMLAPSDAEVVEATLLFEMICLSVLDIPDIHVNLLGISALELDASGVPNSESIYKSEKDEGEIAHSVVTCSHDRLETPVHLRGPSLTRFLQESMKSSQLNGGELVAWVRARITYSHPSTPHIAVATRIGRIMPPPTLRLIYKTLNEPLTRNPLSNRPQDVKARKKRLERVYHEMQNEREEMRMSLQTLYDRVGEKQNTVRAANGDNDEAITVDTSEDPRKEYQEVIKELEQHLHQLEEQRIVEKKLLSIRKSQLPEDYKTQLTKELERQLETHYLKQKLQTQQLKQRVHTIDREQTHAIRGGVSEGRALRGGGLSFVELRALQQEKALYMKLYKEYNDLEQQMVHLKDEFDLLADIRTSEDEPWTPQFYEFVPMPEESLVHLQPQRILTLKIVPGLSTKANSPTERRRPLMASRVKRLGDPGTNSSDKQLWIDSRDDSPIPRITLRLQQATEADSVGHVPMWVQTAVVFPKDLSTDLIPGSFILWEIWNPTPLTHTLYFHRVFLEVFQWEIVDVNGQMLSLRHLEDGSISKNLNVVGITIPAVDLSNGSFSIIRALSKVPRLTAATTQQPGAKNRWEVHVQSTTREYITNGITCRFKFDVVAAPKRRREAQPQVQQPQQPRQQQQQPPQQLQQPQQPRQVETYEDSIPSGISFDEDDGFFDDEVRKPRSVKLVAAAALGSSVLLAAIVSFRRYRNSGFSLFRFKKRRNSSVDKHHYSSVHRPTDMVLIPNLDAGTPIVVTNSMMDEYSFDEVVDGEMNINPNDTDSIYQLALPGDEPDDRVSQNNASQSYLQSPERYRYFKHRVPMTFVSPGGGA